MASRPRTPQRPGKRGKKARSRARDVRSGRKPKLSEQTVLAVLEEAQRPLRLKAVARALDLDQHGDLGALEAVLNRLVHAGKLLANRRGAYLLIERTSLRTGTVQGHADGYGFVVLDEGGDDVFLAPKEMQHVFHGDRVAVRITRRDARGRSGGEVAEVLERGISELVGRYHLERGVSFVVPSDPKQARSLLIPAGGRHGARDGQIVVAEITAWPGPASQALGVVKEVLGEATDPEMEIEIAVRAFGIPYKWPDDVVAEAEAFGDKVRPRDKHEREDFRSLPLVTIDGADARDFDDAVYAEPARGGWRLLVAIADVAHYVVADRPLDREARQRGTSVYFPRRVVPMLPEALSNGLCSLKPRVDRLAVVCDMRLDANGHVTRSGFVKAVIRSHARLTYQTVQSILDGDSALRAEHGALVPHLEQLHALYRTLAVARSRRGALELDQPEPLFRFDTAGAVVAVEAYQRTNAHRIIEECMITANVEAARYLERHHIAALYRVHDKPGSDKIAELRTAARLLGYELGGGDDPQPRHLAKLLRDARGKPEEPALALLTLRSLARAQYRAECAGHYGLGLERYAHFTSPIRRYPDLLVHRAIGHLLGGGKPRDYVHTEPAMESMGQLCSLSERRADEASWDVEAWLKCRYMEDKVGSIFDGRITGMADFGLFVRLDDALVEGMVHVSQLEADYYEFQRDSQTLVGRSTGRRFRLGDRVRVRCAAVRTDDRKIDLALVEHFEQRRAGARRQSVGGERKGRGKGGEPPAAARGQGGPRRGRSKSRS